MSNIKNDRSFQQMLLKYTGFFKNLTREPKIGKHKIQFKNLVISILCNRISCHFKVYTTTACKLLFTLSGKKLKQGKKKKIVGCNVRFELPGPI